MPLKYHIPGHHSSTQMESTTAPAIFTRLDLFWLSFDPIEETRLDWTTLDQLQRSQNWVNFSVCYFIVAVFAGKLDSKNLWPFSIFA